MTITTIKLDTGTKAALDRLRKGNETYDELVRRALKLDERQELEARMREGYAAEREFAKKINKEWEGAESAWPEY